MRHMNAGLAFLYSFAIYSAFQYFDIYSTKRALSKLDVEEHEINPLLVFLEKRFGLNTSFFLMWLFIATTVASVDAFYIQNVLGFPIGCYFFGMFHLLATFNNLQIHFETEFVGADNIQRNTNFLAQELQKRSRLGKTALLVKLNLFNVFVSLFGLFALFLSIRLLSLLQFRFAEPVSFLLFYFPPMMILTLIMFYPIKVFGMFLISRRLRASGSPMSDSEKISRSISVPVDVLETALKDAKTNNASYVQLHLVHEE
jgi:hypothetical protein